jgi:hypothetical protein
VRPCTRVRACVRACVRVCVLRLRGTGCDGVFARHVPNNRAEPLRAPKFVEYAGVLVGSDLRRAERSCRVSRCVAVVRAAYFVVTPQRRISIDSAHRLRSQGATTKGEYRKCPRAGNDAKLPSLSCSDQSDSRRLRAVAYFTR